MEINDELLGGVGIIVYFCIQIFNCGYLPEEWTIENLLGSHRSRPYNPDVANVFFRAGEIETWGRGIERIVNACHNAACPEPTFKYSSGEMWTVFHFSEEYQKSMGSVQTLPKHCTNTAQTLPKLDANATQTTTEMVYNLIKETPTITISELAKATGKGRRTIQNSINRLKRENRIRRIGSATYGGRWETN